METDDQAGARRHAMWTAWEVTVRTLGALFLAYIFVVVLMTASAQSLVMTKLGQRDYTSSYATLAAADAAGQSYNEQARAAAAAQHQASYLKDNADQASDTFADLAAPLKTLMTSLRAQALCDLPDPAAEYAVRPGTVQPILDQIRQCGADDHMPARLKAEAADQLGRSPELIKAGADWTSAFNASTRAGNDAAAAQAEAARLEAVRDSAKDLREPFAPIAVLKDRMILGGGALVQFPPPMMQILIAFFSGTFGALLVALVLIVYPNAELGLTKPGGNYGERVLLGGLIAVCVYIVLGGGTAVLGSTNAFADGTANYRAFSAIGVLAGMFSDRVAQWLSGRANVFYGDSGPLGKSGDKPKPGDPQPAQKV
jgi:hypothetical protein